MYHPIFNEIQENIKVVFDQIAIIKMIIYAYLTTPVSVLIDYKAPPPPQIPLVPKGKHKHKETFVSPTSSFSSPSVLTRRLSAIFSFSTV